MINKTLSQKGSAHVVIIVILVIALLGALGFVFWQNFIDEDISHNADTSETTKNNQDTQTDNHTSPLGYLTLTDYNVKIPLNEETGSLKLGPVTSSGYNETDKSIAIIAPELDSTWKCETDPNGSFNGTIGVISITQAEKSGPYEALVTKKVGNYIFGFEQGGSNCTDSPKYQQLVDAFKIQFGKLEG